MAEAGRGWTRLKVPLVSMVLLRGWRGGSWGWAGEGGVVTGRAGAVFLPVTGCHLLMAFKINQNILMNLRFLNILRD